MSNIISYAKYVSFICVLSLLYGWAPAGIETTMLVLQAPCWATQDPTSNVTNLTYLFCVPIVDV